MIIAPFDVTRNHDNILPKVIEKISKGISDDDDCLIICSGDPGTGKTRLMFHAYTDYDEAGATISQVAMNQRDFAIVLDRASKAKGKRFAGYDEANVNKRNAISKWNKKLIDLYLNIRGLKILHWWNNPSVDMLDKPFIEERVKGLIWILTKDKKRPRLYYYFTQEDLLRLLEDKGNLKKRTIVKYGAQYAYYLGWFKDYTGHLMNDYVKMKDDRMLEKVASFREEFAPTEKMSMQAYADDSRINSGTARAILKYGREAHLLNEGEHFIVGGSGLVSLLPKGVDQMDYIRINQLHKEKKLKTAPPSKRSSVLLTLSHSIYQPGGSEK